MSTDEVEAPVSGTLHILIAPGEAHDVGTDLATMAKADRTAAQR